MADSIFDDNDVFSTPFAQPSRNNGKDHGSGRNHQHGEESDIDSDPAPSPPSPPSPSTTLLITHVEPPQPLCGCNISRAILQDKVLVAITSAVKNSENVGSSASYVVYNIKFADKEAKRRYSEFDSLRTSLARLYPTLIVPPIPEKHSLTDYATMQPNRVKVDVIMIDKRKRMLQSFLNRVARHPILGAEHVFHRFLDNNTSWSEVLHSPPLSTLPKNPLQQLPKSGEPASPTSSTAPPTPSSATSTSSVIPIPSSSHILKNPDPRFVDSETFTNKFSQHISISVDKSQRKVIRRLGDLANDYAELGAVYNGFSLNENGDLANAIEKVGQAIDSSFTLTGQMITSLESHFAEPIQEYTQFAQIIKQVLKYRHLKHAQAELIVEALESKKASLEQLLKLEADAKRLEDALHRREGILDNDSGDDADSVNDQNPSSSANTPERRASDNSHQENPYASTYSPVNGLPKSRQRSWSTPKMNIVSALSHTVQGFLDVDPEATRRNNIGKTKDAITQLEEAKQLTSADLITISMSIQSDLDRFQRQKVKDMRDLLVAYAKIHLKWCQKNLGSWQEAKAEVENIDV